MTTTRTRPTLLLVRLAALLCLVAAAESCYTLVRHPGIPALNYHRPPAESTCTSCHSQDKVLAFVTSERLDREPGAWGDLSHPWWIRPSPDSTRSDGGQSH